MFALSLDGKTKYLQKCEQKNSNLIKIFSLKLFTFLGKSKSKLWYINLVFDLKIFNNIVNKLFLLKKMTFSGLFMIN